MDDKLAILDKMSEIEKYIDGLIFSSSKNMLGKCIDCKKKIKNVGQKTATLIRPKDVGINGRCMIYAALKKNANLLGKAELDNGGDNPCERDLSLKADRPMIKLSSIYNTNEKALAKIAAINIEILYQNPNLLDNKLALQASILQNCLL
jgi:hypothetical protein